MSLNHAYSSSKRSVEAVGYSNEMGFVFGLILGPLVGLLAGIYFAGAKKALAAAAISLALFLVFILFAPFLDLELKIGIIMGTPIGFLLSATPLADGPKVEGPLVE